MNAFLIGPSLGYIDGNRKVFADAAEALRGEGIEPINPLECREAYDDERGVLYGLLQANAAVCLPGWDKDRIGRLHAAVATYLDLPLVSYPDLQPVSITSAT